MEQIAVTGKGRHRLRGRPSLVKSKALRGVSGAALGRNLARMAVPGAVLLGAWAPVGGQPAAMDMPHWLDASVHTIEDLVTPKVGKPFVKVRFEVPVADRQPVSPSGRRRADRGLASQSATIFQPSPALQHLSLALGEVFEEAGRTGRQEISAAADIVSWGADRTKAEILAALAHLAGTLPDARLPETPQSVAAFVGQILDHPLQRIDLTSLAVAAPVEKPGAPLPVLADPLLAHADRRRDHAGGNASQVQGFASDPGLGEPLNQGWSKLADGLAELKRSILTDALQGSQPVSDDLEFIADVGESGGPIGQDGKADGVSLAPQPDAASWTQEPGLPESQPPVAFGATDLAGSIDEKHGITRIRIGALVDMLQDRLSEAERRRLTSSLAQNVYLPIDELQDAGIPVFLEQGSNALTLNLASAQSGADIGGAAGGRAGGSGSRSLETLNVTASAGFDSNPFLSARPDPEVTSLRVQLTPRLERANGRSSIRASGRFEHIEYLGPYRSIQNYGADLAGAHRLNERVEVTAGALFSSRILATDLTNPLLGSDDGLDPGIPTIPGGNDVTLLGQAQSRDQYGANVGLRWTPSDRDEFRLSSSFRADRFGSGGLSASDFYSQQLRYTRQMSESISIGAVLDGGIIDFRGANFGDTKTISPQALVVAKLGDRLTASASFGVAISQVDLAAGKGTNTAFAGNLSLCRQGVRSSLCVTGARQVLPSAIGGARVQTTGGLSYSLRLSERDSVQLGGNYSTASVPLAGTGGNFESVNAFAGYERQLNERMRLQARAGYLDTSGQANDASNFQAVVGISITFGRRK